MDDNSIEPTPAMFHKRKPPIDLSNFKVEYNDGGINPLKHFKMINFNYDITKILSDTFKMTESLDSEVIKLYFRISPKKINKFNFNIDEMVVSYKSMPY